jgi:hypothetical protein
MSFEVEYEPIAFGFKDRTGTYYSNIIFVKTQLLDGFTHILGFRINPDTVSLIETFAYVRIDGVSLEGFYRNFSYQISH